MIKKKCNYILMSSSCNLCKSFFVDHGAQIVFIKIDEFLAHLTFGPLSHA